MPADAGGAESSDCRLAAGKPATAMVATCPHRRRKGARVSELSCALSRHMYPQDAAGNPEDRLLICQVGNSIGAHAHSSGI
eukprot:scaffold957_cov402-Prasinococcus_capsulatus_cf.AAC.19